MRRSWRGSTARIGAAACAAVVLIVIATAGAASGGRVARAGGATTPPPPPAPEASPAPQASPSPAPQASPSPEPSAGPEGEQAAPTVPQEEPLPRIIRTVCTDHECGGCDGKCRKSSGHVAVDKKGHCACTPTEGSALDRAIRGAYERRPPQ